MAANLLSSVFRLLSWRLVRSRVEPGGFEVAVNVGDGSRRIGRQRYRAARDHAVDVVHAESDTLEMERGNRAGEAFGFRGKLRQILLRRQAAYDCEQILDAPLGRESMVSGHSVDNSNGMYQSKLERAARWLAREFAAATAERSLQK
jgi:hypothetical protein